MIYLLSKQPRYFFDQEAVREKAEWARWGDQTNGKYEGKEGAASWIGAKSKEELTSRASAEDTTGQSSTPTGSLIETDGRSADTAPARTPARRKPLITEQTKHGVGTQGVGSETFGHWAPNGRNIRSVWEIATQPYPEAHFATFPEELAQRCIAAGTSERGRCPECGAPWVREVERSGASNAENERIDDYDVPGLDKRSSHDRVRRLDGKNYQHIRMATNDWVSGCLHTHTPIPTVVLDPFIGSGTVAHVARKLGRHAVGIDLNESYLELAARRLQQQSLFAQT